MTSTQRKLRAKIASGGRWPMTEDERERLRAEFEASRAVTRLDAHISALTTAESLTAEQRARVASALGLEFEGPGAA